MGVFTSEMDIASPIHPAKLFKAFVLDGDSLILKALPSTVESLVVLEGDGGPGSIKQLNFFEGSSAGSKYLKMRIDVIDKENYIYEYTIFEADSKFEKIEVVLKFEASPDGAGSICEASSKYYPVGGIVVDEEEIKAFKEQQLGLFKASEAYLLANPDA